MEAVAVAFSMSWPPARRARMGRSRRAGCWRRSAAEVYRCLGRRRDALFELADAVLCQPGRVHMLANLSLEPEHRAATARCMAR